MRVYDKPPLTFEQQLRQLIARGLRVDNEAEALQALERINYYRLSGYWHVFKRPDDTFAPDGSFREALRLYEFDRRLRLALMDAIERVEVTFRCQISYHLAHERGAFAHEDPALFDPRFSHGEWLADVHMDTRRSRETFVQHFQRTYEGFPRLPIWVAAELMSFGSLSRLYKGLLNSDKSALARSHGVHWSVLQSWLHSLTYVRNVCAHHGRLWNRELAIAPRIPQRETTWTRPHVPNPKKMYVILCVLQRLARTQAWGTPWASKTIDLLAEFDNAPRWQTAMGIPASWRRSPRWRDVAATSVGGSDDGPGLESDPDT